MPILSNRPNEDREAEGEDSLELAVVTYTGSRSVYNDPALRNQGWPSLGALNKGTPYVVLLPDSRLGWYETHADLDIEYGQEAIAGALVTENSLDDQVFGPGYDPRLRDRVFESLDIDVAYDADGYREQLIDLAGVDEADATDTMDPEAERREDLMDATRNDLMQVTGEFDHGIDAISSATKSDLVDVLVEEDDDEVDALIEDAQRGDL